MAISRRVPGTLFVSALLVAGFSTGCTTLVLPPQTGDLDRAYIEYWPPAEQSGRLRLAVKDLIDIKGVVTTAGSEYVSKNSAPATRDAALMAIARERGVQLVGKTNTTELAVTVTGRNDYYGTPVNRLGRSDRHIPGGSSSGSAVAVANGTADVAFGTDTAGSVRVPAACCGVYGLKTTYGLVSLKGVFPLSPDQLDTVGPLAKDVPRLVQGMDLLERGFAGKYAAAVSANRSGKGIKVGRLYVSGTDRKIDQALDESLAKSGFQVINLNQVFKERWEQAEKDARTVALGAAWKSDSKYADQLGVSGKAKAAIYLGQMAHPERYQEALSRKADWQRTLRRAFREVDYIALPTLQQLPPKLPRFGRSALFEARVLALQNTAAVNYAGNPAIAIPVAIADEPELLTSLQLIGPRLSEAGLINAARIVADAR